MVQNWNLPPSFSTMRRPGIASVVGGCFILDGTTIDEVEKYHLSTVEAALRVTNEQHSQLAARQRAEDDRRRQAEPLQDARSPAAESRLCVRLKRGT